MLLKVSSAGENAAACCAQVYRWILNKMAGGWQEVLPKQAPEAAEANGRETTLKSVKK